MLKDWYKNWSVKALSLAITPSIIGDVPDLADDAITFYVLSEYSRANSLLLEEEIQRLGLPSAISPIKNSDIDEDSAMIFLTHRRAKTAHSPRLARLIKAYLKNPNKPIHLVPVTILWGRAPDKEESLFKLLFADEWRVPSITKQLFNIGVMGRDTFVRFYEPKQLGTLLAHYPNCPPNELTGHIQNRLAGYLLKQRTSILGPDLSDKRNITHNILTATSVQNAIAHHAKDNNKSIEQVTNEAKAYIDEIASDYSYSVVRVFERFLTWLWTRLYDGVKIQHFDRVRTLAPDYQVVYVPCHRSHMDYLLLSYVIHTHGLRIPHVAAGANLNIPILGEILRSGGAFFLRRSFRDNPLYGTVFKEYLHNLMQKNSPLEYFIEGGRSRSGRLLAPKMGMLAMTVTSYLQSPAKPVVFIPTYISYERIMEGATYVGELKGKPKEGENLLGLLKTAKKIERIYGQVNLSFGTPLFLDDFLQKFAVSDQSSAQLPAMIDELGLCIMQRINQTAVVNPVSLVALVLLSSKKAALDESVFLQEIAFYQALARALPYAKDITVTDMDAKEMMGYAMGLTLIERTPHTLGNIIKVADKQAPMLSYFKNNILHVFILPSLVATLVQRNQQISIDNLYKIAKLLYPFLKAELFLSMDNSFADTLKAIIDDLAGRGLFSIREGVIKSPTRNSNTYQTLTALATPAEQSLERYFMALTILDNEGSGKLQLDQVVELAYLVGSRASVLYGDDLPDLFDKALFTGFLNTLINTGYVSQDKEGYLHFDTRINHIVKYARFALNSETLALLQQLSRPAVDKLKTKPKKVKRFFRSKP